MLFVDKQRKTSAFICIPCSHLIDVIINIELGYCKICRQFSFMAGHRWAESELFG